MLKLRKHKGCGNCEKCNTGFDCKAHTVQVEIIFNKPEKWEYWGRMVTVFRKGEVVKGYAVVEDGEVYCASAESNIYEGITDFIDLENVEIKLTSGKEPGKEEIENE